MKTGKDAMQSYPNHVGIKYYYLANLGRYGQTISKISAHQKGITKEIRSLTNQIIEVDPEFAEAGAMRILGAIHLKVPPIPLVLSWPSDEKGVELLTKAYQLAPENPGNTRLYAEALLENNNKEEAQVILSSLMQKSPRTHRLLEDKKDLVAAKKLYNDLFD